MYGWSKYGGPNMGLIKEELEVWFCQCCSREQTKAQGQFMIEITLHTREYARICAVCRNYVLENRITTFRQLLRRARKPSIYIEY